MTKLEKRPSNGREMAELLKRKLSTLFEESKIEFAYLGGSWSKEKNSWWSDIDIFISDPKFIDLDSKPQLTFLTQLSVRMTESTDFEEIEISVLESLPLHVQFDVIHNGILIYERSSGVKANYIEKLLPRYYDHMIWYKRLLKQSKYLSSSEKSK